MARLLGSWWAVSKSLILVLGDYYYPKQTGYLVNGQRHWKKQIDDFFDLTACIPSSITFHSLFESEKTGVSQQRE